MLKLHPRFLEIHCTRSGHPRGRKSHLTRSLVAFEGWSSAVLVIGQGPHKQKTLSITRRKREMVVVEGGRSTGTTAPWLRISDITWEELLSDSPTIDDMLSTFLDTFLVYAQNVCLPIDGVRGGCR